MELKSVNKFESIHEVQLLTYLKLSDLKLGILINFNVPILKEGIKVLGAFCPGKRIVNNLCALCGFAVNGFFFDLFGLGILT